MKEKRKALCSEKKNGEIAKRFLSSSFMERTSYFVYLSAFTEVATGEIINGLLAAGKKVCVPRLLGENMISVPFSKAQMRNRYGISEPTTGDDTPCEVALVPLLAIDRAGYRLGYGGGYYDRYLQAHPKIFTIGLCYKGQKVDLLPHDEGDIPLCAALCEEGFSYFE